MSGTQPAESLDRYDLAQFGDNAEEQFAKMIYDISPTKTPFLKNAGRGQNFADYFSWQTDKLRDPNANNAHIDGAEWAGDPINAAVRLGNYNQIIREDIVVTRRADKVKTAGRKKELARQVVKKGKELKRDQETIYMGNQGALAGDGTTAPLTASVCAFYRTNEKRGAGGTAAPLSNGTHGFPNAAATDGTLRALSETLLLDLMQDAVKEGGDPSHMMVGPEMKRRVSNYMFTADARIATQYQDQGKGLQAAKAVGSVDFWLTDFGPVKIQYDLFQRERDVHLLDFEYWSIDYLDSYKVTKMGKSGDNNKRMMLLDAGLCCKNEAASGIVADVDSTTAMVA